MSVLSPILQLEVGGAEIFRTLTGPALLVALPSAPLDPWIIASAVPLRQRMRLRRVSDDTVLQKAQLAAGSTLLAVSDESWVAELAVSAQVPIIPVGVRGAFAVGDWADITRRRIPRAADRPRVAVRFGSPLALPDNPADAQHVLANACERLVIEDQTTWWESLRTGRDHQATPEDGRPTAASPGPGETWRDRWAQTGPMPRGGPVTRRRIWR